MARKSTYKVVDLFGNEELKIVEGLNRKPDLFTNYDAFVEKFEAKKQPMIVIHQKRRII